MGTSDCYVFHVENKTFCILRARACASALFYRPNVNLLTRNCLLSPSALIPIGLKADNRQKEMDLSKMYVDEEGG